MRPVTALNHLNGKRVLVRVDLNIPQKTLVGEGWKLERIVPTIKYLQTKRARVILMSHLGRPDGKRVPALSLAPIARRLGILIGSPVMFVSDCVGPRVESAIQKLKPGGVLLLQNLRFYKGEEGNDASFAKKLAAFGDYYVNDAFAASHRAHASIVGVPRILPHAAGLLLEGEVKALSYLMKNPKRPFVVVLGGAKIGSKIGVIQHLLRKADQILIGTAMSNTFLYVKGCDLGGSLMDRDLVREVKKLLKEKKIVLPVDVVVGSRARPESSRPRVVSVDSRVICTKPESILDIGPQTIGLFAKYVKDAKTIVWNGPVGLFEVLKFSHGTLALGRLIASRSSGKAFGVVGGGETVAALEQTGMARYVDWISTGGGAMLEFLEGKVLPGIKALT